MPDQRRLIIGIVLVVIGLTWFLPGRTASYLTALLGLYVIYQWYSRRKAGESVSPWILGTGLVLFGDNVDSFFGYDMRFQTVLLLAVGITYLLDRKAS